MVKTAMESILSRAEEQLKNQLSIRVFCILHNLLIVVCEKLLRRVIDKCLLDVYEIVLLRYPIRSEVGYRKGNTNFVCCCATKIDVPKYFQYLENQEIFLPPGAVVVRNFPCRIFYRTHYFISITII